MSRHRAEADRSEPPYAGDFGVYFDGGWETIAQLRERYLLIDPENRVQITMVAEALGVTGWGDEALRECFRGLLAGAPEPPLAEPGTWGVVEAACVHATDLRREWVRHPDGDWYTPDGGDEWSDLLDPVLIRDGVE